jgi:hypothetical protein
VNNIRRRVTEAAQVLLLVVGITACHAERDRLDAEVRRLCALDGGIKVYEKVRLPPERFDQYGIVAVPERAKAKPTDDFIFEVKQDYLVRGNPELWRWHAVLIRQKDLKVLGESISYTRRGGDLPGPWHPSKSTCPEGAGIVAVKRAVFSRADTKRQLMTTSFAGRSEAEQRYRFGTGLKALWTH